MAYSQWVLFLHIIRICGDVNSSCCTDISSVAFGVFKRIRKQNVQHNSILCFKEHNRNSWTFGFTHFSDSDLLLHDSLCTYTWTVLFALSYLLSYVILWWIDWIVYWKHNNGLERHSCRHSNIFTAYDCILRIFQKQRRFASLVWMALIRIS